MFVAFIILKPKISYFNYDNQYRKQTNHYQIIPHATVCLFHSPKPSSAGNHLHLNMHHLDDSRDCRRLIIQLEETERHFDDFWKAHLFKLRQCADLRKFEYRFRELQVSLLHEFPTTLSF